MLTKSIPAKSYVHPEDESFLPDHVLYLTPVTCTPKEES